MKVAMVRGIPSIVILTCLGLLPGSPSPIVIAPGVPSPIIIPTAAPTVAPTVAPTQGNMTIVPMLPTVTFVPTLAPTQIPTTMPAVPTITNFPPMTSPTTMNTTPSFTLPPTTVTTAQTTLGPISIDPRFGAATQAPPSAPSAPSAPTVPSAPSAPINMLPITAYSAQVSTYDSAVNFPRSRRSVNRKYDQNMKNYFDLTLTKVDGMHNIKKRQTCACVPAGTCNTGTGTIDIRIVTPTQCPAGQQYCCSGTTTPVATVSCGARQAVPAVAIAPAYGQASYGEFPWQALILTKQNDYIAGGVLIDGLNVLTVTHRVLPYVVSGTAPNVKVRLGEWDAAGTYEPVPYKEYTVSKVFSHPSYNANTLQYDITVFRLASAVPFTPAAGSAVTINRACLPPAANTVYTGQRCMVSGWGKDMFGQLGQYQQILKKVDVPIVAPATCQSQLQAARLGASYVLDTTSFVCAGGEANKDSCTGDGGSGLVCQVNGQWVVVGLVAWGLGCATANVPGVYVNVAALLPWIQQQVATP